MRMSRLLSGCGLTAAVAVAVCLAGCATTETENGTVAGSPGMTSGDPFEYAIRSGAIEDAVARADAENRVLIVVGTADWCGPCRRMKADAWSDPQVKSWVDDNALIYYLDIDEQREVSRSLDIRSIPQIVAFHDGEEVDRIVGYRNADAFLTWLGGLTD